MDDPIAVATFILAVFTGGLAWATRRMARAAEQQAAAARLQVERAHRPVIVPLQRSAEKVRFRGGEIALGTGPTVSENPPERDDLPRYSAAFLPIENVGMGPALNVRGEFKAPRGSAGVRFPTEGIAAGSRHVIAFETWTGESISFTGDDSGVSAVIKYDDVAGRAYRTEVFYDIGSNAYSSIVGDGEQDRPTQQA